MLLKRIMLIALAAFLLNFAWEMLQMQLYTGMNTRNLWDWYLCFRATLGDVVVTLLIYMVARVVFGGWNWAEQLDVAKFIWIEFIGAAIAIYFEISALKSREWSYSKLMPMLPFLNV